MHLSAEADCARREDPVRRVGGCRSRVGKPLPRAARARSVAQRSRRADAIKDSGSVSMFPALAEAWYEQWQAQKDWNNFQYANFLHLKELYGVNWVVLQPSGASGLSCPYHNSVVAVCQIGN